MQPIIQSVNKTKHLIVVDNAWLSCGASAEIISQISELNLSGIKVKRLGFAKTTCPTTPSLEAGFYPNPLSIAQACVDLSDKVVVDNWQPNEEQAQLIYQMKFKGPF